MAITDYIAYYKLNGNKFDEVGDNYLNLTSLSPYELIPSGSYNFTTDKDGNNNSAIYFTNARLTTRGSVSGSTTSSMSFWFDYSGGWSSRNQILIRWVDSKLAFGYFTGSDTILLTTDSAGRRSADYDNLIEGWNHVVVTRNGTEYKCYINGIETTYGASNYWSSSGHFVMIGRRTISDNFTGSIDDIKLFNRVLTSQECSDMYNESISQPTDYLYRWDFKDKSLNIQISEEYVEDRYGNSDSAYNFDIGNLLGARLDFDTPISDPIISISMWYKYVNNGETFNVILNSETLNYNHLLVDNSGGYLKSSKTDSSSLGLNGSWQHIVLVMNYTNTKIYLDGNLVLESSVGFDNSSYPLSMIGNSSAKNETALSCIDDIKIYDFELTSDDVLELYNESPTPDPPTVSTSTAEPNYDGQPTWIWNTPDGATGFRYSYNESSWSTTTGNSFTPSTSLSNGSYTLYVQATSDGSNYSTSGTYTIEVTNVPSAPTVTGNTPTTDRTPTWSWNTLSDASLYRYSFDEFSGWVNTTSTNYTPISDLDYGNYTLYVQGGNGVTWGSIGSFEIIITPSIDSFASRFPIIYSEMQKQEISQVQPRIYISNVDLNENNNLDSYLQVELDDTSFQVKINGDWSYFEGLVVINDEILYLSSPNYLFSQYTLFTCERAKNFTKAFLHDSGTRVRSIQELEVIDYNYSHKANTTSTSIFAPVLSSGEIVFLDEVKKWLVTSTSKEYDLAKNKPIYIFEGAKKQVKCVFQGYIYDWQTDAKASEITLMFKDEFTLLNSKNIEFTKVYINQYVTDIIEDLLDSDVYFMNGTNKEHYGRLDRITTADYETYGAMISYICEAKCMRVSYDEYGYICVYSDLFKTTDTFTTELEVKDSMDLVDINETTENTLVLNKFTCNFKNRYPYYDRNQFLDGSVLRYIKFRYTLSNQSIKILNNEGFINFNLTIGTNIKFLNIGDYILLKDRSNKLEFRAKLFEVNGTVGTFIGGFDRDRAWNPRGKIDYLIGLGYTINRNFDVYYSEMNLQTIFALNSDINGENKLSGLKIPILPGEELEYNCTFGSFETNDVKFSGIVEEIEGIYDTLYGGTDLLYLRDYEQSEKKAPVYLLTNKLSVNGSGNNQLYYYNSFDNSDVEVNISPSQDNESNITLQVKNTLTPTTTFDTTPLETITRILRVQSWEYNSINTGDVIKLHPDNALDDRTEPYYSIRSDVKWIIESKFSEGSNYYIVLDKAYPIGDDTLQMKFMRYTYDKIIHLNELRIMGNPIVEEEQTITKLNADSINKYDELEYKFDGKLTNLEDLKYSVSYLYNNFAGLPNNYTRIIPFEAFFRPDIGLLDVVTLYDSSIVDMEAEEVIIIEKAVSVSGDGERSEKYLGVTKVDNLATLTTLNIDSSKNNYKTLYPTEYNHNGNEGLETEKDKAVDDLYVSRSSKVGNISMLKIPIESYYGISQTTIRNNKREITLNLYGALSTYNITLFKNGNKSVIIIGTEYILVKSKSNIASTSNSVTLEIIERDIFETEAFEITFGQKVQMAQILQYTDKDGIIIDGVITVGSVNGRIDFLESGLILDDYSNILSTYKGLVLSEGNLGSYSSSDNLIEIKRLTSGTERDEFNLKTKYSGLFGKTLQLQTTRSSSVNSILREITGMEGLTLTGKIDMYGIVVKNTNLNPESGLLKFENNKFYGYNGSSWVRLDNESITPYPGYADEVILPNNGTSFSVTTGRLQWAFNNLYFNISSNQSIPCLTQFNQTYSSNFSLDPYVKSHLINVSSNAVTVTVGYTPSNPLVVGKTYEIIHMTGDVIVNNITINGTSSSFYEVGTGTNLGSSLTISTIGEKIILYPIGSRWYVERR